MLVSPENIAKVGSKLELAQPVITVGWTSRGRTRVEKRRRKPSKELKLQEIK